MSVVSASQSPSSVSSIASNIKIRTSFNRVKHAFESGDAESGKAGFREFSSQLYSELPQEQYVFKLLWQIQGEPEGDPIELGSHAFYDMNNRSSTLEEKKTVINSYGIKLLKKLPELPPSVVLCPGKNAIANDCEDSLCSEFHVIDSERIRSFSRDYYHVLSPSGKYVHAYFQHGNLQPQPDNAWTVENGGVLPYSSTLPGGDLLGKVGIADGSTLEQNNTTGCGYRPIGETNYTAFGYLNIGKRFWVDPDNRQDVEYATKIAKLETEEAEKAEEKKKDDRSFLHPARLADTAGEVSGLAGAGVLIVIGGAIYATYKTGEMAIRVSSWAYNGLKNSLPGNENEGQNLQNSNTREK